MEGEEEKKLDRVKLTDCEVQQKLDGIIICASTLKVLMITSPFQLNTQFTTEIIKPTTYKGLILKEVNCQCETLRVNIGKFGEKPVAFVFNIHESSYRNLTYLATHLRQLAILVVEENLRNSSTWADWRAKARDHQKQRIFMDDIYEFGEHFLRRAKQMLKNYFDNSDVDLNIKIIVSELGQDCNLMLLPQMLVRFDLNHVEQLVLHYAKDFSVKGSALFWNCQGLLELLGNKYKSSEYAVCLLKGYGNYYFKIPAIRNEENLHVAEAKFYSEPFKQVHRGDRLSFATARIAKNLFCCKELGLGFVKRYTTAWETIQGDINTVSRVYEDIGTECKKYSARFETILRFDGAFEDEDIFQGIRVIDSHSELNNDALRKCLGRLPTMQLKQHLKRNLEPFIRTLQYHVKRRIEANAVKKWKTFHPGHYFACAASEAIICFCLYGAEFRNRTTMIPKWLHDSLGLKVSDFRRESALEDWLFPIITITNEKIVFEPMNQSVSDAISTMARTFGLAPKYYDSICELDIGLDEYDAGVISKEVLKEKLELVARTIVAYYKNSSINFGKEKKVEKADAFRYLELLAGKTTSERRKFITTQEFVDLVFDSTDTFEGHEFSIWMIQTIRFLLKDREELSDLRSITRTYLEKTLFMTPMFFAIPIQPIQNPNFLVVAPLAGVIGVNGEENVNFNALSRDLKEKIKQVYTYYIPSTISLAVIEQVICQDWSLTETFELVWEQMKERTRRRYH